MEDNEFEKHKSEFWKRFNRSKRFEKKLILIALSQAKSQGKDISVIPFHEEPLNSKNLPLIFDGEDYNFSEIIDYSKRLNPSMYRKYEEDSKRCKDIFYSISINLD